jgi:4-amino-4-deoxy-L-arabinose transferase-like glycosyltransferase
MDSLVNSRRTRIALLVILAAACLVRLGVIISIDNSQTVPRTLAESDASTYYVLAESLLDGIGYRYSQDQAPTARRTPGYPLFITSIFRVFGHNFNAVRGVQCALDLVTTVLVFGLALVLTGSTAAALLAALAYAMYPPAILSTTYIMTETLYTMLLMLFTLACVLALKAKSLTLYLVSGIMLGLAVLTRPGVFLLPIAVLVVALFIRRTAWRGMVILMVAFAVTMLPWGFRNKQSLGKFTATSTLMGHNLYKGNHLPSQGAYFWSTDSLLTPELKQRLTGVSEIQRDSILQSEAVKMMLENKRGTALLMLRKIARLWFNLGYGRPASRRTLAIAVLHALLIGFAFLGASRIPGELRYLSIIPITTILFSSLMYLIAASEVRFVFPLIPLLLAYSAIGFLTVIRTRRGLGR